jgi:hypothetical protein
MTQHTIFCFNNGGSPGFLSAIAIGDDGVVVAGHCCSNEYYMPHDLGITSDWKHDNYDAQYGEGNWKLEWVDNISIGTHTGLQAAFALNKANAPVDE